MEQMNAFIEKAKNDKALMAKLDALGASGAEASEIVALAAEHGFAITEEDLRQESATCPCRTGELTEAELDTVAGGNRGATENRYNPTECAKYDKAHYWCVGFMQLTWCDHFSQTAARSSRVLQNKCAMGFFDYEEPY